MGYAGSLAKLLSPGEAGTTAGAFSLDACARELLGVELPKQVKDAAGRDVRTGFGRYLNKPVAATPADSLRYAAGDAAATWRLFLVLSGRVRDLRLSHDEVFGDLDDDALAAWDEHGPLTHHVQLKSAILCDVMRRNGVGVEAARAKESHQTVAAEIDRVRNGLAGATFGDPPTPFVAEGAGSSSSLQTLLDDLHARRPDLPMARSDSGKWKADEEALKALVDARAAVSEAAGVAKADEAQRHLLRPARGSRRPGSPAVLAAEEHWPDELLGSERPEPAPPGRRVAVGAGLLDAEARAPVPRDRLRPD